MLFSARHLRTLAFHLPRLRKYRRGRVLLKHYHKRFAERPRVAIVGAAGGLGKWGPWAIWELLRADCFEPDPVACQDLKRKYPRGNFVQAALGDRTGTTAFHETEFAQCSSCLEPDSAILSDYSAGELFRVKRAATVSISRFDDLFRQGRVQRPDFLQMDVQGFEAAVLEGFGSCLTNLVGIECESHLKPLYKGEKPLWELIELLEAHQFVLRHLESQGPFGGEFLEVNAFFLRKLDAKAERERELARFWELVCELPPVFGKRTGIWP